MVEAAAHAAAIAQAIKASGVVVHLEPADFLRIVYRQDEPIVVRAPAGFLKRGWSFLTTYKGLAFFTESREPLALAGRTEMIEAKTIWIPG